MTERQRLKIRGVLPLLHVELYYILLQMVLCMCACSFSNVYTYNVYIYAPEGFKDTGCEGRIYRQQKPPLIPRRRYCRSHVMNSPAGIFAYFARGLITRPSGIQSRLPPHRRGLGITSPRARLLF